MTPLTLLEPEVMLSGMQREAFARAVAQAKEGQGLEALAASRSGAKLLSQENNNEQFDYVHRSDAKHLQ